MSRRKTWFVLVLAACAAVVCCRQVSAARDVPDLRATRVCIDGVRLDVSGEPPENGAPTRAKTRPREIGDPCGLPAIPLRLPGAGTAPLL